MKRALTKTVRERVVWWESATATRGGVMHGRVRKSGLAYETCWRKPPLFPAATSVLLTNATRLGALASDVDSNIAETHEPLPL